MLELFQNSHRRSVRRAARWIALGLMSAAVILPAHRSQAAGAPRRIVSIGGATTEIVYALGEQERVVGVDTTSSYPPQATKKASVGYMRQLSAEGVLSLRPDLILMEDGSGPPQAVSVIDAAGIPVVHVPVGYDADAIGRKIEVVAKAIGKAQEGKAMADRLEKRLAELKSALQSVKTRRRVLFVLSMSGGRPMAAGADTGGDAIIRLAGGTNVFGSVKGYKTVSSEAAASLAPDVVLMMSHAGPSPDDAAVLGSPAIAGTPAGRNKALIRMDGLYLLGFGPRTADAARDLASRLYPGLHLADSRP